MRTTLDLPEDLLEKAMSLSQIKTKTQVITLALQEMIRKSEISDLKKFKLLEKIKKNSLKLNWGEIISYQVLCLQSGSSGIGIPDLIIAQNAIQNNVPVYSIDKHFKYMHEASFGMKRYL